MCIACMRIQYPNICPSRFWVFFRHYDSKLRNALVMLLSVLSLLHVMTFLYDITTAATMAVMHMVGFQPLAANITHTTAVYPLRFSLWALHWLRNVLPYPASYGEWESCYICV